MGMKPIQRNMQTLNGVDEAREKKEQQIENKTGRKGSVMQKTSEQVSESYQWRDTTLPRSYKSQRMGRARTHAQANPS